MFWMLVSVDGSLKIYSKRGIRTCLTWRSSISACCYNIGGKVSSTCFLTSSGSAVLIALIIVYSTYTWISF